MEAKGSVREILCSSLIPRMRTLTSLFSLSERYLDKRLYVRATIRPGNVLRVNNRRVGRIVRSQPQGTAAFWPTIAGKLEVYVWTKTKQRA